MRPLLSFFTLLLILSTNVFSQTINKNEIPFELLPSGHLLVKAKIDGVQGSFVFDTGAGITMFTKSFFSKLKDTLREDGGYTGFRATGERLDIDLYLVKNVEFGPIKKDKEEVSYIDANFGGIDGIISLKLMVSQPFTIDYEKKVIRLESAQSLADIKKKAKAMPVQLEQSRNKALTLFSYFKVNDTLTLQFSLDSGAGKDVYRINSKYLQSLGVDANDSLHVKKIAKRSEMNTQFVSNIYITKLSKLAAASNTSINTTNFPAQFVDGLIYDGIIWINWLGSKITFDLAGKQLLVSN
jgi:hypothetical protein